MLTIVASLKWLFEDLLKDKKISIEEFNDLIKKNQKEEELKKIEKMEDEREQRKAALELANEVLSQQLTAAEKIKEILEEEYKLSPTQNLIQ